MDKKILEYQKKDIEIARLEKENNDSEYTKIINDAAAQVKLMQSRAEQLSTDAQNQIQTYNKLKLLLEKIDGEVEELSKKSLDEEVEKALKDYMYQISKIQGNIMVVKNNMEKINKLFEDAKVKVIEAKAKHKDVKSKKEQILSDVNKKIEALKSEMAEMEKGISSELIKKYQDAKNDNIMPVFVPMTKTEACGGCMQKIATNQINKLKQDKILVCEHCRRYIIYEE